MQERRAEIYPPMSCTVTSVYNTDYFISGVFTDHICSASLVFFCSDDQFRRFYKHPSRTCLTRKQSEPADLRQGHVVRQVAAPYSVWQRFPLCPIERNVNENFRMIQNPGFLPDHPQNWTTGSFCHSRRSQKISERFVHNFLSYLADTQTDRQTNEQSLAKT